MTAPTEAASPPEPGTEYPYAVADIAHAAAKLLGDGWRSEAHHWGTEGRLTNAANEEVRINMDYEGDLCVSGPTSLEPVYLSEEDAPATLPELQALAVKIAAIARDITT